MSVSTEQKTATEPTYLPQLINAGGSAPVLLICEHATNYIPDEFSDLGLTRDVLESHVAWDPGALDVACQMAQKLDAPLISASVSRLLYDCNRPPHARDAIPEKSEIYEIPGNADLNYEQRQERINRIYNPFTEFVKGYLDQKPDIQAIVTIHSFTPVYNGKKRSVDIGLLHDEDTTLANAFLNAAVCHTDLEVRLNEPYSSHDGVTHSLKEYGTKRDLHSVMIEIKNSLINNAATVETVACQLTQWSKDALTAVNVRVARGM
ncbi:N-formylglutamate amidohydrolase [Sneathiella glossodoripedis]|uniref:N-formylglutamate amidohydrolase n=1 Tax=Sneathiella glossodoripedis TaxID=418853 RepID=UPI000471D915|nr:N-formylglutamate amidohydrolase [Sneathiella glossodoripedis]